MRGNFKGRAYEIFRKEGPLALLPLDRNLYQIIWTSSNAKSADRLNADKNLLIDNLNTKSILVIVLLIFLLNSNSTKPFI